MKSLLFFLLVCMLPISVDAKRPVIAVLEYRAGVTELPDLADRFVELLRDKTNYEVLSPQDCRRMVGTGLDARVQECKEDPACFSRMGKKLGASEILLIRLTEFGTVLINVSRTIVQQEKKEGMVDLDVELGGNLTKLQVYRILRRIFPEESFRRYGTLEIKSNQKGATVILDDRPVGQTPIEPMRLQAPRTYGIELTKPGFIPFSAKVDLVPNSRMELNAQLAPEGSGSTVVWYRRWWVIPVATTLVLAVGGTVWYFNQPPQEVPARVLIP